MANAFVKVFVQLRGPIDKVIALVFYSLAQGEREVRTFFDVHGEPPVDTDNIDVGKEDYKQLGRGSATEVVVEKYPALKDVPGVAQLVEWANDNNGNAKKRGGYLKGLPWALALLTRRMYYMAKWAAPGASETEWSTTCYSNMSKVVVYFLQAAGLQVSDPAEYDRRAALFEETCGTQMREWFGWHATEAHALTLPGYLCNLWIVSQDTARFQEASEYWRGLFRLMKKLDEEAEQELFAAEREGRFKMYKLGSRAGQVRQLLAVWTDNVHIGRHVWEQDRFKTVDALLVRNTKGNVVILARASAGLDLTKVAAEVTRKENDRWFFESRNPNAPSLLNGSDTRVQPSTAFTNDELVEIFRQNIVVRGG